MGLLKSDQRVRDVVPVLLAEMATLWHKEAELAKAEISINLRGVMAGVMLLGAAVVLLVPLLFVLIFACIAALTAYGFAAYWAALMVAGGLVSISMVLSLFGLHRLKSGSLLPRRAMGQMQQDISLIKRRIGVGS